MIFNMIAKGSGGGGGGSSAERKDINFFDYDGTIVASYTAQEWAGVTALPDNPSHDGLTAQGWNHTLAQINTSVSTVGKCDVGQMYVTSSGDTEIDIELDALRKKPYLGLAINGTVVIDWGDGSETDTVTGTSLSTHKSTAHTYSNAGEYTIKIKATEGEFIFYGNNTTYVLGDGSNANTGRVYANAVKAIRIGNGLSAIGNYGLWYLQSLKSITMPNGIMRIDTKAFQYCYSLKHINIPTGFSIIDSYAFNYCGSLETISLPNGVELAPYAFANCSALKSIVIPSGAQLLAVNSFYYCYSLEFINIPNSITAIGGASLNWCCSLTSLTIPSGVTSIQINAFNSCYGLKEIIMLPTTPPTLTSANVFNNQASDCIIYVPSASLEAYKTAQYWSNHESRIQALP